MIRKTFLLLFIFVCTATAPMAQPAWEGMRLNDGWEFLQSDLGGIWEAVRVSNPDRPEAVPRWREITLPHCYNAEDAVDPARNYYQGPGWYRKNLTIDNPYPNGRTLLHFEGAGQKTEVYVYTTKAGEHVGGYDEFTIDITDAVEAFRKSEEASRFQGFVPVSIRVDNSRDLEMIPSDLSDFNLYGGIYRHLNLVYVPVLSLNTLRIDAALDKAGTTGELDIYIGFLNHSEYREAELSVRLFDPAGKEMLTRRLTLRDFSSPEPVLREQIQKPRPWSPDDPNLYTVEATLRSPAGEMTVTDRFGFRHFEFVKKGPFVLNGERLLLKGVHRHEDHAGVGAAMTDDQIRREMFLIKEMGANFIRLGHYQQSRQVLELCDELGILVWEEIPWCRGGIGGETYRQQARRMLRNMIAQHRNHPSIILWGLGNENDWPNDFPEFDRQEIRAFMRELHDLSHELDDSRLTAIRRCSFCKDIVDVYSPSIWAGWYNGAYVDYKSVSRAEMLDVDRFLHVEWGADSHAGRFAENPYIDIVNASTPPQMEIVPGKPEYTARHNNSKTGEWNENYQAELIDWTLTEQVEMPWLTGAAYWSFKDFSTPLRPENPVPYVNQKGLVERDLTPKEAYYVFQSHWSGKPMARIFGHRWETRWGEPGETKRILVYSNCDEAELFLNGRSLGKKKRIAGDFPASGLRWDTVFAEGRNEVKVIAVKGNETVQDETAFEYETRQWGEAASIEVNVLPSEPEYRWVEVRLLDANGILCLDSRQYVEFDLSGDGALIRNLGTSSGSYRLQALNGKARIRVKTDGGRSVVAVRTEGLPTVLKGIE